MIHKGVCDKEFIWNSSNCEYDFDKSCDVGEYLDYENVTAGKKIVETLIEECTEIIDEVKINWMASFECKNDCKSLCRIYAVLIAVVFTISVGIDTYYIYYKYMNIIKKLLLNMTISIKHQIINVNRKYQRSKHQKSNLLFFRWYD